jgi:argininosuccinate synthase
MHKQKTGPLVVLAYSGGLDTSAIVPWLREQNSTARASSVSPPMWGRGSASSTG